MKLLICHRDQASRGYFDRLAPSLPGMDIAHSAPGAPIGPLDGVDALLVVGPVGREAMERGTFRFIQTVGAGYDHIDVAAATELGIRVAHVPSSKSGNAESVAEHAILLMLALSRRLAEAERAARQGKLAQPLGYALLGKTACIAGLGAIGTALAARLRAFGMKLTGTRRDTAKPAPDSVRVYPASALAEAAAAADYVVVCARAGEENAGMIDRRIFAAMKRGAFLVNVARGSLVDEGALLEALQDGRLAGAGLDVFSEEPIRPGHPLLKSDKVIATPHVAGVTDVNLSRTLELIAANLRRFARGETPEDVVNAAARPREPAGRVQASNLEEA